MFPTKTKARANGTAAVATDKMPPVPTLTEALPELGKAQTALELSTERVEQLRAEINATKRALDNLGEFPSHISGGGSYGQLLNHAQPEVAAAWRVKHEATREKLEQLRAQLDQAKLEHQYCRDAEQRLHTEAREAVAAQLRPYWQAVVRDFTLAKLASQAGELVAIEKARALQGEMAAQGVNDRTSPYGELLVSVIDLGPWFAGPYGPAFSRAQLLHEGVVELINAGVLTIEDIETVAPELVRLWNLKG